MNKPRKHISEIRKKLKTMGDPKEKAELKKQMIEATKKQTHARKTN
jgi:hypothetical protein